MMQKVWDKMDKTMQEKFNGDYGAAIYDETLQIVFLIAIHHRIKENVKPQYHADVDRYWYGSLSKNNPLHPARTSLTKGISSVADATYDPKHNPIAALCKAIGDSVHHHVSKWATKKERNHEHDAPLRVKAEWVNSKASDIDTHINNALNPRR
jgi:hypothetical protein